MHRYDITTQQITILNYMQIITMRILDGVGTMHKIFTYYAGIMPNAFLYLLCSKLCQHNRRGPTQGLIMSTKRTIGITCEYLLLITNYS